MNNEQVARGARSCALGASAFAFYLAGCASVVDTPGAPPAIDTQVTGEQFSSLEVSPTKLSGVFVKGNQSLAFQVDRAKGAPSLRLSTASGEVLYSVSKGPRGSEIRIGSSYRSFLPAQGDQPVLSPKGRTYTPAGFESTGDPRAAMSELKGTQVALLPSLAAALGRVGLDGASAPISLPLHLTAMRLTEELKLELDPAVAAISNRIVAARMPAHGAAASPTNGSSPENPDVVKPVPDHARTLGLVPTGTITCPGGRPPCAPGKIVAQTGLFAGCCINPPPPPPPDFSNTPSCASGVGREVFASLRSNPTDPCLDNCLGMCGPGCDPWHWVCGDEAVHVACWNHDRAYCPATLGSYWGIPIPNPDYPVCMAEYAAYSALIGADTVLGSLCSNDWWADYWTSPPFGLWTSVPNFWVTYK